MAEVADRFKIQWLDFEREPQCKPNPNFPNGIDIRITEGVPKCKVELPYPAKRCGAWIIKCSLCGVLVGCTTAGRPDDPKSMEIPCKPVLN